MKILLVEDNRDVRLTMVAMLTRLEFDVEQAESAEAALEILGAGPVDMIVADYNLPNIDGVELLSRARKMIPNVATVIASGIGSTGQWEHVDEWLTKPFRLSEMKESLLAVVAGKRAQSTE